MKPVKASDKLLSDLNALIAETRQDILKERRAGYGEEIVPTLSSQLVPVAALWIEYRWEGLPIDFIFGTPIKQKIRGFPVYTTGFNLST